MRFNLIKNERRTVVVGGGISGLTTAYILTNSGYHVTLLERAPELGGLTNSYHDEFGNSFDLGFHVLDYNRSKFTTAFFKKLVDQKFLVQKLNRAIVLESKVIPYNGETKDFPESVRALLPKGEIVDASGENPTPEELARIYGAEFVEYIFGPVTKSFDLLTWRQEHGYERKHLLNLLYPWFFPRSNRQGGCFGESDQYHDQVRIRNEQHFMYPAEGGFERFLEGLARLIDKNYFEPICGVRKMDLDFDRSTRSIKRIVADGREIPFERVYWCVPAVSLCKQLGMEMPKTAPQSLALGSFAFESDLATEHHEVLVGDPEHRIDRISFPGRVAGRRNNLVQVEFLFPEGRYPLAEEDWRQLWRKSLIKMGLVTESNPLKSFGLRIQQKGFLSDLVYGDFIEYCRKAVEHPESNITYPFFGLGPENINRLIPSVFKTVIQTITSE